MIDVIEGSVDEIQNELVLRLQLEFFRGDAFQILMEKPEKALLVAVLLRAALCGDTPKDNLYVWDARMAIGVGGAKYRTDSLAKSNGDAFCNDLPFKPQGRLILYVETCANGETNDYFHRILEAAKNILGKSFTYLPAVLDNMEQIVEYNWPGTDPEWLKKIEARLFKDSANLS